MLELFVGTLHVILAGAWLGGVVFTTTVVSPALKSMRWDEAEQARVRSVIGRQYAKVGTATLVLLMVSLLSWRGLFLDSVSPSTASTRCWRCSFPLRPGMPRGGSRTAAMAPEINTHERLCQTSCSRTAPSCRIT